MCVRGVGALLLTAGLLAGAVGVAAAHSYDGDTAGVWSHDTEAFKGRVWSDADPCVRKRLVKLQELDDDTWETVAKTRSGKEGRWRIEMEDPDGEFRHVIRPRSKGDLEHSHECDRFASGMLVF